MPIATSQLRNNSIVNVHVSGPGDRSGVEALPLHLNFFWTAAGNITYALSQWGMIVILAKLTSAFMVGQFALGIAISTPAIRLANLQLRSVQVSDTHREYHFREYLGLRFATTTIALLGVIIFAIVMEESYSTTKVICAVAAVKAIEAVSDIYYGLFQANDRLDRIGQSMILKAFLSTVAFATGLYLTRDVSWGLLSLGVSWLLLLLFFDARSSRRFLFPGHNASWSTTLRPHFDWSRQFTLVRLAFPLGIMMALVALNLNMPRYFVHSKFGEEQLGVFSALAYMTIATTTLADALGNSATPALARMYARGALVQMGCLLKKLLVCAVALGAAGFVVALLFGRQILQLAYGPQYAHYANLFSWLMASGGAATVASVLTAAITATRAFRYQVFIFTAVCGTNLLACWWLVPLMGLTGAAIATLVSCLVVVLLSFFVLTFLIRSAPQEQTSAANLAVQLEFRS
jgi:O-antigen/teichoic acid export membrane protein